MTQTNSNPSVLYILGNGFDLAHGLPTKFCCFHNYLKNKDDNSRKFIEEIGRYTPLCADWSNFEEALGRLDFEEILNDNSCYLIEPSSDDWHDRDNHDFGYEISKTVDFSDEISRYLKDWIKTVKIQGEPRFQLEKTALFLTFNYTCTLEELYEIPDANIFHIHGCCCTDTNLICGHNNKMELSSNEGYHTDFREQEAEEIRLKYFKSTYKNPERQIEKFHSLFEKCHSLKRIVIIGHSFETAVDDDYFFQIRKIVGNNCNWELSYHSCEDCRNNKAFARKFQINNYKSFEV